MAIGDVGFILRKLNRLGKWPLDRESYVCYLLLVSAAFLRLPRVARRKLERWKLALDVSTIAVASAIVVTYVVLFTSAARVAPDSLWLSIIFPIAYTLVIFAMALQFSAIPFLLAVRKPSQSQP